MRIDDFRTLLLLDWLKHDCLLDIDDWKLASSDASFRRYFRISLNQETFIVMDAPPEKEAIIPFIQLANLLKRAGVNTPAIIRFNVDEGFILLEDFGDTLLLNVLRHDSVDSLYAKALQTLYILHSHPLLQAATLPPYDAHLLGSEMTLFSQWFVENLLQSTLNSSLWTKTQAMLVASALEQPQVFVHLDYHARNLMCLDEDQLGVLDFQDAVRGPITYDLVSLLRDCYIDWPCDSVRAWLKHYFEQLKTQGHLDTNFGTFERWFDWMGLQRHLKAMGIFARLYLRDAKPNYLQAIPRTFGYAMQVSAKYPLLSDFHHCLSQQLWPLWLALEIETNAFAPTPNTPTNTQ